MKKLISLAMALCMALALVSVATAANDEMMVLYAQVPEDWESPCLWAWSDDGQNAFDAWPGGEMDKDPGNEGWYYGYVPTFVTNVIVNANNGGVQTADYKVDGPSWIVVTDADTVEVSGEAMTEGEAPAYVEKITIHAQVPEGWEGPSLWAWQHPEGVNAFAAWPGKAMQPGAEGWVQAKAPVWVNAIIINANEGGVQTEDIEIDAADVWVTVAEDGSCDFTYNDPNAKEAEDITVYVQAPADWEAPCLWAWSAPDGTNAFSAWPGEPLAEGENGWLTLAVPGWINSLIVNGTGGTVQTADISVEPGQDVYLVVEGPDAYTLTYEAP